MAALLLLSALAAIAYLIAWMIQNDGAQRIQDQKGLYRMLTPGSAEAAKRQQTISTQVSTPRRSTPHSRRSDALLASAPTPRPETAEDVDVTPSGSTAQQPEIVHPLARRRVQSAHRRH